MSKRILLSKSFKPSVEIQAGKLVLPCVTGVLLEVHGGLHGNKTGAESRMIFNMSLEQWFSTGGDLGSQGTFGSMELILVV